MSFARAVRRAQLDQPSLVAEKLIAGWDRLLESSLIQSILLRPGVSGVQRERAAMRLRALAKQFTEAAEQLEDFDKEGVT